MISFALNEDGEASCHALVLPRRWEEALAPLVPLGLTKLHEAQLEAKAVIEHLKPSRKGFYFALIGEDRGARRLSRRRFRYSKDKVTNLPRKSG